MVIFFQSNLFLKEFLACSGCFGLFTKIKKEPRTSFQYKFPTWLFHKNISYLMLYQWTKFQYHTCLPCEDIKQNVLTSYLDSWSRHILSDLSWINLKQWLTGRKRGEDRNTKIWITWKWKELFGENETFFIVFKRLLLGEK